jgi:hypothetical protein
LLGDWIRIVGEVKEGESLVLDPSEVLRLQSDLARIRSELIANQEAGLRAFSIIERYKNALEQSEDQCEKALSLAEKFRDLGSGLHTAVRQHLGSLAGTG